MRKVLLAVALVGLVAVTGGADNPKPAQDKEEPSKKEKPPASLKVGDPAPALKASKWLQGDAVKKFEPGKVYVVEFWATWCGPCILMMPHTAELQAQYKDKGVTFIGYSARDPDNTEEKVAAFVKRRGPKLPYTFAYGDDRTTYDAWITAAGLEGIPRAFVVDKAGRIAYLGSPMYLGVVLPKVVASGAQAQAISNEVGRIEKAWAEANQVQTLGDDKASLKALLDFEAKYPSMANVPFFVRGKLIFLARVGEAAEAKKFAEAMMAKAIEQDDALTLMLVSSSLRRGQAKGSKELMALAVKAAEARVEVAGDKDVRALIDLASTYFAAGDKAKAKEYARKAVAAAAGESAALKQYIEQEARKLGDEKQEYKE